MEMLDKDIVCIKTLVQFFVSCLVSCVNCITTGRYASRSYTAYMIRHDTYNMHIMCIYHIK